MIYLLDHPPPHVHVFKGGARARVRLGRGGENPTLWSVGGMSAKEAARVVEIVADQQETLRATWRRIHGE